MDKNTIFYSYKYIKETADNSVQVTINIDDMKHFINEFEQNEFIKLCSDWQIELNKKKLK